MDLQALFEQQQRLLPDQRREVEEEKTIRWVTFRLGNETYGVDVMKVQEVLRLPTIAPVPGAPPFVIGIFNLRGTVVTVVDANLRFGLGPKPATDATRVMIVEVDDAVVGLKIDAVSDVVEVPISDVHPTPRVNAHVDHKYIQAVAHQDQRLIMVIDSDRLLRTEVTGGLF
jgi:purine-binding chemotaxis protein CheW